MPHELIYTSAPRGLKPGSSGYCTVAQTPELPKDLADQLEGISHYRHLRVDDPGANPPAFVHSILTTGYFVHHVLSRVVDSGLDHSGRSNYLAHHVVFDPDSLSEAGPAWLCAQSRMFVQKWDGNARQIPGDRATPIGRSEPGVCKQWQRLTGDAGWGGALASATNAAEPAYVIYEPGQDVLGLLVESMALLPPDARWTTTFNTYFTGKAVRTTCQWRCVTADSAEAREAIASRRGVVIRLDEPMSGRPEGALVAAARTGQVDHPAPKRRQVPAAPMRTPRPYDMAEDLPESEPAMPASRPIRSRPAEPPPESEDSQYDLPVPSAPRASGGKGGIGPLILGLLLGGLLVLALTAIVELVAGLSFAGDYKKLKEERDGEVEARSKAETRIAEFEKRLGESDGSMKVMRSELNGLKDEMHLKNVISALSRHLNPIPMGTPKQVIPVKEPDPKPMNPPPVIPNANDVNQQRLLKAFEAQIKWLKENSVIRLPVSSIRLPNDIKDQVVFPIQVDNPKANVVVVGFSAPFGPGPNGGITGAAPGGEGFAIANPGVDQNKSVRFGVTNFDKHPLLALSLIRVESEGKVSYYQAFERKSISSHLLPTVSAAEKQGGTNKYRIKYESGLDPALRTELSNRNSKFIIEGRRAALHFGILRVELDRLVERRIPDPTDPNKELTVRALTNRPMNPDEPAVELTVQGTEIVVEAKFEVKSDLKCSINVLDVVRVIPSNEAMSFPGHEQELLRIYPYK